MDWKDDGGVPACRRASRPWQQAVCEVGDLDVFWREDKWKSRRRERKTSSAAESGVWQCGLRREQQGRDGGRKVE
jgi:hypothetical protein